MMRQIRSYTKDGHTEVQIEPHGQLYITLECFYIVTTPKRIMRRAEQDTSDLLLILFTIDNLLLDVREDSNRGRIDRSGNMSQYDVGLRRMLDIADIIVVVRLWRFELHSTNEVKNIPLRSRLRRRVQSNARSAGRAMHRCQVRRLSLAQ